MSIMSEVEKTEKERIMELKDKIFELRKRKLLTIEGMEEQGKKLNDELIAIQNKLLKSEIDAKIGTALIKSIDARRGILREYRLAMSFLTKEEGRLEFEIAKLASK